MPIKFAARSDKGKIRKNNEDNLFCNGIYMEADSVNNPFFLSGIAVTPCIFAICDGMGGEDCGETASFTAVKTLSEHADIIKFSPGNDSINAYVNDSAKKLREIMRKQRIRTGTTLALVLINQDSFSAYNLGDSRIYRFANDKLIRVTDDHTVAEDKVRMGLITQEKADRSPERNILTRCLGIYDDVINFAPDCNGPFDVALNSGILICSDGLTDMLSHKEIADIIAKSIEPAKIVNELVDAALNHGGIDNITCIYCSTL